MLYLVGLKNPIYFKFCIATKNITLICVLSYLGFLPSIIFRLIFLNISYVRTKLNSFPKYLYSSIIIVMFSCVGMMKSSKFEPSLFLLLNYYICYACFLQQSQSNIFEESMIDLAILPPISGFKIELQSFHSMKNKWCYKGVF